MTPKPEKIIAILSRAIYPILAKNTNDTRTLKIWVVGNSLNYFLLKLSFATLENKAATCCRFTKLFKASLQGLKPMFCFNLESIIYVNTYRDTPLTDRCHIIITGSHTIQIISRGQPITIQMS